MVFEYCLKKYFPLFPPGRGPEWGSGGIYGLLLHGGILYFTLSMEAKSFFIDVTCEPVVYDFDDIGSEPRSGGDTYNVSVGVDNKIFFGGWVHAPPVYRGGNPPTISFENKYSHVHVYDIYTNTVKLLWAEGLGEPDRWAGEVTDMIYNPLRDSLVLARGDGHEELGFYELPSGGGKAQRISRVRVLRLVTHYDMVCGSHHWGWGGAPGVTCLDLESYRRVYQKALEPVHRYSVDGGGLDLYRSGDVASLGTRLMVIHKGGVSFFEPPGGEAWFTRLLDLGLHSYGPLRVNALPFAGGVLAAWNTQTAATIHGTPELPEEMARLSRRSPAPTVLLYIAPPVARIVAVLGYRVTSIAAGSDSVILAWNTAPNLERYDATRLDPGYRGFTVFSPQELLLRADSPPLTMSIPVEAVAGRVWGGVPLAGYREPRLRIPGGARVTVYTYDLETGPGGAEVDTYTLGPREELSLSGHGGWIVSFRLERARASSRVRLVLE